MKKSTLAVAVLLACFALAPASAKQTKNKGKAASSKVVKAKAGKATSKKKASAPVKKATAGKTSKVVAASKVIAPGAAVAEAAGRLDRRMEAMSMQYLTALWRIAPEDAIFAGKFDNAASLSIPDAATRAKKLAFINEWREKFGNLNTKQLSPRFRTDLALVLNSK